MDNEDNESYNEDMAKSFFNYVFNLFQEKVRSGEIQDVEDSSDGGSASSSVTSSPARVSPPAAAARSSPSAPAMNMSNLFAFGADSIGTTLGNMHITTPVQTFAFGGPSRATAERESVEIDEEEDDDEDDDSDNGGIVEKEPLPSKKK